MREQADAAIRAGEIEPLVIVGIYNAGDRRLAEYTHERDWQTGRRRGGRIRPHAHPRTHTLDRRPIPRAPRARKHRRGWVVARRTGLPFPRPATSRDFGKLAVLSPSVWWNPKSILAILNERAPQIWDRPRVWLDVGDREGHRTLHNAEKLNQRLKANGWRPSQTLHFERVHGGTHDEASWAKRVRPMLRFLFPAG